MNPDTSYVLFVVDGQRYAVPTDAVSQIVGLPELTPVPGAPPELAGVFDLAGAIVPVLDFSVWLKRPAARYLLTDQIILLYGSKRPFGIIVNGVTEVCARLTQETMLTNLAETSSGIMDGAVGTSQDIVLLPDLNQLLRYADAIQSSTRGSVSLGPPQASDPLQDGPRPSFESLPAEAQRVFRQRARSLMRQDSVPDNTGLVPLAVVGLNGEYFGIALEWVREFTEARNISRVPCCPEHIIGNMNLRGEILTLVDVRPALKMPAASTQQKKIIVLDHDGITAGVAIDEVFEAGYLDPAGITRRFTTTESPVGEYISGTAPYGNRLMAIVDVQRLFETGGLVVNEEV